MSVYRCQKCKCSHLLCAAPNKDDAPQNASPTSATLCADDDQSQTPVATHRCVPSGCPTTSTANSHPHTYPSHSVMPRISSTRVHVSHPANTLSPIACYPLIPARHNTYLYCIRGITFAPHTNHRRKTKTYTHHHHTNARSVSRASYLSTQTNRKFSRIHQHRIACVECVPKQLLIATRIY